MKLPKFLICAAIVFVILAVIALGLSLFGKTEALSHLGSFALLLTLGVLIIYTYYTYSLAKEAWTPSASIQLVGYQGDPYKFRFVLQSYCKQSLECWIKLNASINGKSLPSSGFFNAQTPFNLQPLRRSWKLSTS